MSELILIAPNGDGTCGETHRVEQPAGEAQPVEEPEEKSHE